MALPSGGVEKVFDVFGGGAPRAHKPGAASDENVVFPACGLDAGMDFIGKRCEDAVRFDRVKNLDPWDCGEALREASGELVGRVGESQPSAVFEDGSPWGRKEPHF